MATLYQTQLYSNDLEVVAHSAGTYKDFTDKFKRKKTTDDCYTPEAVYNVIVDYVKQNFVAVHNDSIIRPFKPGGDYLAECYDGKIVIDNPPFSIYSKIIENYERLGVFFFLFAPALTTFVKSAKTVSYIITGANITYANGAKVRTNFVSNIPASPCILISHSLKTAIENAQRTTAKELCKTPIPAPYLSSAQLLKWANVGDFAANITHDYITHNSDGRKIFGAAVKLSQGSYTNLLNTL